MIECALCWHTVQVTSAVVSFVMKFLRNAGSKHYLTQLEELGFLIHWESLLSTHGDEIGMLEDFIVAIYDLNQLKFRVSPSCPAGPMQPVGLVAKIWLCQMLGMVVL